MMEPFRNNFLAASVRGALWLTMEKEMFIIFNHFIGLLIFVACGCENI